jgi:hypothetical protein
VLRVENAKTLKPKAHPVIGRRLRAAGAAGPRNQRQEARSWSKNMFEEDWQRQGQWNVRQL